MDANGNLENTGWYIKGPICYVNEPSTCSDIRPSHYYPTGYSWEACDLEHHWMGKFVKNVLMSSSLDHHYICV